MNILDTIIATKKEEVKEAKIKRPVEALEQTEYFKRKTYSLKALLTDDTKTGIIAEFKRRSPSRGIINDRVSVETVTRAYTVGGASGLSVLTDQSFFGGSNEDISAARMNNVPILRKDFIIDEYQVTEAKSIGADAILLIAANLTPSRVKELAIFAKETGLEILLEIHTEMELEHICDEVDIVGVNNRDLRTFIVDINRSVELRKMIPAGKVIISESGINDIDTINLLKAHGFKGFLIGDRFMREENPGLAFEIFVRGMVVSKRLNQI